MQVLTLELNPETFICRFNNESFPLLKHMYKCMLYSFYDQEVTGHEWMLKSTTIFLFYIILSESCLVRFNADWTS